MAGLTRFSAEEKIRMKRLQVQAGKSCNSIAQAINLDRPSDRPCTARGVRTCLKRMSQPTAKRNYIRKLGPPALLFIDAEVNEDREISGRELQRRLHEKLHINASITVINCQRRRMGWVQTGTRYCQMIRAVNKEKRLFFCTNLLVQKEDFSDCIFTDESTVRCERFLSKQFRRIGEPAILKPKPKHPLSVHVWAGISRNGTTDIAIFTGIMDSSGYQTIMKDYLLPFIARAYPDGHRLVMDNDPKHRSKSTKEWMNVNKINHWPTPPESPDLNPIERIWAALKYYIRRHVKPTKKEELVRGIRNFWATVTPEMCARYINHILKDAELIIANLGGPAGH
jgi:transposase